MSVFTTRAKCRVNMMTPSNGNIFRVTGHLCGEFTGPGEFPTQRPVPRSFDVFFDLRLNKRLSKQPWSWWFETQSWSLWHHCNECACNLVSDRLAINPSLTAYSNKTPCGRCPVLCERWISGEIWHILLKWPLLLDDNTTPKHNLGLFYDPRFSRNSQPQGGVSNGNWLMTLVCAPAWKCSNWRDIWTSG